MTQSSTTFMFLQLLVVATPCCLASTEAASLPTLTQSHQTFGSVFVGIGLDEAMYDAFAEAFLALTVFGIVSALLRDYRRRNPKTKAKAKAVSSHEGQPSAMKQAPWRSARAERSRACVTSGHLDETSQATQRISNAALCKTIHDACQRQPQLPPSGLNRMEPFKQSEMDALASAVRAGKAWKLPDLLDAALERSMTDSARTGQVSSEEVTSKLLLSAMRACAASRCFTEAVAAYDHVAERIGEGNANLWSVLLYSIVETGTLHHCQHVLDKLCSQTSPSVHDFVNMVRCYAGLQDAVGLRERLRTLRSSGHSVDTYTWNRALAACGSADCALELAEELLSANISTDDVDAVGYNTLMKYNARAGRVSRCFELRAEMSTKGVEPSEVTFGILLDACVAAKELDLARNVFSDLCASGLRLNVVHCTTFIKVLVASRLLDEAANVLDEMIASPGVKPDLITFSIVSKAYADHGDVASALKVLELMLGEGVKPDEILFNSVLSSCGTFPLKSSEVMHTFKKLLDHGMKPTVTTLSILLKGLAHSSAWAASLQVLKDSRKMFGLTPEPRLFAQLAQACVKARDAGIVLEVFDAMLEASQNQGKAVDKEALNRFLRSCLLGGAPNVAVEMRQRVERAGITIDSQMDRMFKTAVARRP